MLKTVEYKDEQLVVLDQTQLPTALVYEQLDSVEQAHDAIATLKVRGAPLIGVVAAYAVCVGIREHRESPDILEKVEHVCRYLRTARPTAVNLSWALDRMLTAAKNSMEETSLYEVLMREAIAIHREDSEINKRIGEQTYQLIKDCVKDNSVTIMTHCNAGVLGTTGYGTATSVMYLMKERGIEVNVYASETRPLLQGARLTAFELSEAGIEVTLITDSMAATVLSQGIIDFVIVGADRVAANLDVANKVGTLGLAILARHYQTPFYVACPSPTFDENSPTGKEIVIEERDGKEITSLGGACLAPQHIKTYNPSFDVTPAEYITAVITENGALESV